MTKNPVWNALAAFAYVVLVVQVPTYGQVIFGEPETVLIPIAMLSLFVFSAALMGFIFFYEPVLMLLDGHKKAAMELFLKTLGIFGGIILAFLVLAFVLMH